MPAIPAALVALIVVIELIAAIGALYMARGTLYIIAQVLKHTIGRLWIIGPHIEHAILSISDPLMTWLGNQATGLQGSLVHFFHGMWRLSVQTATETASFAADTYGAILRVNNAQRALIGLAPSKPAQKAAVARGKAGRYASKSQSDFNHRTNQRLATLERDVGTVRRHGVPVKPGVSFHGLEARLNTVEHKIVEQRHWLRHQLTHPSKAEAIAFFGVATQALSLNWLRCRGVGRAGRGACGLNPNLLGALLADALLIAGGISIVELAKECQGVLRETEDGLKWFVRELGAVAPPSTAKPPLGG